MTELHVFYPFLSSFFSSFLFVIRGHSTVAVPVIFAAGLLIRKAIGTVGIPVEVREVLALVLERPVIERGRGLSPRLGDSNHLEGGVFDSCPRGCKY